MMDLKLYIEDLLYRYECVIVPEFGAFLTHYKSAQVHESTHAFYPPNKEVSFNAQLHKNDGLLASYISSVTDKPYEEVLQEIKEIVDSWNSTLHQGGKLSIDSIGVIRKNEEGRLQFQPNFRVNFLMDSFGMTSFVSTAIERESSVFDKRKYLQRQKNNKSEEVVDRPAEAMEIAEVMEQTVTDTNLVEENPTIIAVKPVPHIQRRIYLKYAAAIFLGVAISLTGYRSYKDYHLEQSLAQEALETNKEVQEAGFITSDRADSLGTEASSNNQVETVEAAAESKKPIEKTPTNSATSLYSKPKETVSPKTIEEKSKDNKVQHAIGRYQIIGGAFRQETNADKQLRILHSKNIAAIKLPKNRYGLYQIAYGTFDSKSEAITYLHKIKRSTNNEAWMFIANK
ncbi:MAG: SPOR domain-containing protein [Flavobacteriaceae bacterium]|nr:SPOR domain-containing protein [Flavobacteriaceae bacterium]